MPGVVGAQIVGQVGSRFYFQRDPISSVPQPIVDFGTVQAINPSFDPTTIELRDSDGGTLVLVDEAVTQIDETYEITGHNLAPEQAALAWLSNPPADIGQAATQLTSIRHYAHPGRLVKLLDADYDAATPGEYIQGITSVDTVTGPSATPTYTLGTDYEVVSLERGIIRMIDGGSFSSAGPIEVTLTPRAIQSELRRILPGTVQTNIQGNGIIVYSMQNNARQMARIARFSITPAAPSFSADEYSTLGFSARILYDLTASQPAGRLDYWLGALPPLS
jgi:hypothetical protein